MTATADQSCGKAPH